MRRLNRFKDCGHQMAHIETIQCTTLLARRFFFFQLSFLFKCVLWFFLFTCFFLVFFFTHWMPPLLIVVSFIPAGFSTGCCILHYPFLISIFQLPLPKNL